MRKAGTLRGARQSEDVRKEQTKMAQELKVNLRNGAFSKRGHKLIKKHEGSKENTAAAAKTLRYISKVF